MSTINGLPAHILLNHFVVVLAPLTAILAIVCVLWPAARRRLIWLVLVLGAATLLLTQLTASSGAWLIGKVGPTSPVLKNHAALGDTLIYLVAALAAALALLAAVHLRHTRGHAVKTAVHAAVSLLVIAAAVTVLVQTYRIGESGARAAWGNLS
jgi:glucan phosphoethanolaminetransferase (alkaline phosphatase superfamily)